MRHSARDFAPRRRALGLYQIGQIFDHYHPAFDLAVGPGGEVIVSANPLWPAANADTGLWHVGPHGLPREVLRLSGPSGPVLFDAAGNLLVAELGRVIPPPVGAVRRLEL